MNEAIARVLRCIRARIGAVMLVCGDLAALLFALTLSFWLRYDNLTLSQVIHDHLLRHLPSVCIALCCYSLIFRAFRLYRYAWRFASLEMLGGVVIANAVGLCLMLVLQHVVNGQVIPYSVAVIFLMLSIAMVGGMRIFLRMASLSANYGRQAFNFVHRDTRPKRIIILGGGPAGARLLNALLDDLGPGYEVIGILDDSPRKNGIYIRNARVLGPMRNLYRLLEERAVDEVLIALPAASGAMFREYVLACRRRKVPVKIIPAIRDVLNGQKLPELEEISVEDLLRRPPVRTDLSKIGGCIKGARVMVTGAGGSIGSELCRQIMRFDPATLILLGHGENSIHQIYQELRRSFPDREDCLRMVIASVADEVRMDQVFNAHRPQMVFHTAAHKHVPIMETNLIEAIKNNVLGSNCVAECCGRYGVQRMVLISTDKAVMPSSVMGATKWLCEEVTRAAARKFSSTSYVTVRFGNVLGSRGSVVPIFHEAIKRRGPICVTHPEMTRFFMSIPEAVQLVLQASAFGNSGQLYVLDMGEPVKIMDLACDMIRLCGFEPNSDIPITFTGIRNGEKLHEALVSEDEAMEPAACDGLFEVHRPQYFIGDEVTEVVTKFKKLTNAGDTVEVRNLLGEVVPGFAHKTLLAEAV
ncbi:MAG: nucleoside-diphosphate sugar epimerase/dehydratase [Armatimonadota bacterium]|nr:polysaccharide biosynthesis protein [bacterium]